MLKNHVEYLYAHMYVPVTTAKFEKNEINFYVIAPLPFNGCIVISVPTLKL